MKLSFLRAFSAAAVISGMSAAMLANPLPAAADDGSSAFTGAAVGSLVGSLLFDSGRNQYYYVNNRRRVYVHDSYARNYYAHRDPGFYRSHQGDFNHNRAGFNRSWSHAHGDRQR